MRIFSDAELSRLANIADTKDFHDLANSYRELNRRYQTERKKHRALKRQFFHVNSRLAEIKKGFVTLSNAMSKGNYDSTLALRVLYTTGTALKFLKDKFNAEIIRAGKKEREGVRIQFTDCEPIVEANRPIQNKYKTDSQVYLSRFSTGKSSTKEYIY